MAKEQLVEAIIRKFGSQRELAKLLGKSESALSALLKKPSQKFLISLADMGINIDSNNNQINNSTLGDMQKANINSTVHDHSGTLF